VHHAPFKFNKNLFLFTAKIYHKTRTFHQFDTLPVTTKISVLVTRHFVYVRA